MARSSQQLATRRNASRGGTRLVRVSSLVVLLLAGGCATTPVHVAVPAALTAQAELPGYPAVRFATTEELQRLDHEVTAAVRAALPATGDVALLALTGGGARGGFGAGFLCGWTARGDRPPFQVVCGVSSGALIAPFAFLGPAYDDRLRTAFTEISRHDIYRMRNVVTALDRDALFSTEPLDHMLAALVDAAALQAIAAEHRRGRRLYMLSTDLDAQRAVVWDMGAIAASGRSDAPALFRRVMLASAALPVAFPPQYFPVEAAGNRYDEMHVDGGLMVEAFLPLPPAGTLPGGARVRAYVIVNGKLSGDWMSVPPRLIPIAVRTFHTLTRSRMLSDVRRIQQRAQETGATFQCARIPPTFALQSHAGLDPAYMRQLFELGRAISTSGGEFLDTIPARENAP